MIENILSLTNETTPILFTSYLSLLWWLVATLGLTFGITHSKLTKWLRDRVSFLKCPQCVGLYSGLFVYLLDNHLFNIAFSSSFICFVVYLFLAQRIKDYAQIFFISQQLQQILNYLFFIYLFCLESRLITGIHL